LKSKRKEREQGREGSKGRHFIRKKSKKLLLIHKIHLMKNKYGEEHRNRVRKKKKKKKR
jgi:hypothetical protein